MELRGRIVVKKNHTNDGVCTKFHGESGRLYYADLKPKHESTSTEYECNIFPCTDDSDNYSGIEWEYNLYKKQCDDNTPNTLRKCVEAFLGYPVNMVC